MAMVIRSEALLLLPLFFGAAMADFFNLPFFGEQQTTPGTKGGGFQGSKDGRWNQNETVNTQEGKNKGDYKMDYKGKWELVSESSGVNAMHVILMPTNRVIIFDATNFGPSKMPLPPGVCRPVPNTVGKVDCWAHAVEYDPENNHLRPLKVMTNPWCSSGALDKNGTLVQTGGWNDGGRGLRFLDSCTTCNWEEYPMALSAQRWYSTQHILADGRMIVIGGRRQFNYEFVPERGQSNVHKIKLPFLKETTDEVENNLYPFVYLNLDGNLFILANNRSILFDHKTNSIVREFPILPGGSRNYPSSAMSVLLPIKLRGSIKKTPAEVLVCGGAPSNSPKLASTGKFIKALSTCGRLVITKPGAQWRMEKMPTERVMGDMLLLPNTDILLINGGKKGSSGWDFGDDPNFEPLIYKPTSPRAGRFKAMKPSTIPRMYHSTSVVLPDGRILVAGSNPNNGYNFTGVRFPTEFRMEKFSPNYLDPELARHRPSVVDDNFKELRYGKSFKVPVLVSEFGFGISDVKVTMLMPPFTTHGYSMNQRMLVLRINEVQTTLPPSYQVVCVAPPAPEVAPPGYYLLFVINRGLPSKGTWVRIQ